MEDSTVLNFYLFVLLEEDMTFLVLLGGELIKTEVVGSGVEREGGGLYAWGGYMFLQG